MTISKVALRTFSELGIRTRWPNYSLTLSAICSSQVCHHQLDGLFGYTKGKTIHQVIPPMVHMRSCRAASYRMGSSDCGAGICPCLQIEHFAHPL